MAVPCADFGDRSNPGLEDRLTGLSYDGLLLFGRVRFRSTPSVSGCSRPRSSRVSTCFRQISTSLWMCARALACGGRCCSRRRSCKRSLRPTARCLLASVSDGGRSGRSSKSDSYHEKQGGPLAGRKPPRRETQVLNVLPKSFDPDVSNNNSLAHAQQPVSTHRPKLFFGQLS